MKITMKTKIIDIIKKIKTQKNIELLEAEVELVRRYHYSTTGKRLKNCPSCIIEYLITLVNAYNNNELKED